LYEYALKGGDDSCHGVEAYQRLYFFRQNGCRVDDGGKPEPELQKNTKKVADITKEDIQYADDDGQADGKQNQYQQYREDGQVGPAWEVAADQQKGAEQAKDDGKVETCIEYHDGR